jgi:hypothetical protein
MLPTTYLESRATFRQLAQRLNAGTASIPYAPEFPHGADLSVDTAYLGPDDAPTLIVIASGTHGVEGYGGAACQFRFMRAYASTAHHDKIGFLLVHAVNPWGFFHDRRVTHEGVDLNRNFVDDFSALVPSTGYAAFHQRLVSDFRPLPGGFWNEVRLLKSAIGTKSRADMRSAITGGQYSHPDGLFYGGTAPTRSRRIWEAVIAGHMVNRTRAVLVDIHTGLGKAGSGELISYLDASSPDFQEMSSWFGGELQSMQGGQSVTAPVEGTLTAGFDRLVPCKSHAIGLEFGTRSPLAVLNAMRFDHWVHNNAVSLPADYRTRAQEKMKQAFSIEGPTWHDRITRRFDRVMAQLIAGLDNTAR